MKHSYTTSETADICQVSRGTVLRWIRKGRIKTSVTFGGHHRIDSEDLIRVLQELGLRIPEELLREMSVSLCPDHPEAQALIRHYFKKYYPKIAVNEEYIQDIERLLRKNPGKHRAA